MPRARTRLLLAVLLLTLAAPAGAQDVTVTPGAGGGFVVEDNTGAIERLRVDEATGNISRNGALFVHTTGTDNTFVGEGAGSPTITGAGGNSAFGRGALSNNTRGYYNSAFGAGALKNTGAIYVYGYPNGSHNSAFGHRALYSNTSGGSNSAFGQGALSENIDGYFNSAFGANALHHNKGYDNSAFGAGALFQNIGYRNSAFGVSALTANTFGERNSAFGVSALVANTFGERNSAFGEGALSANTEGDDNSAFGYRALFENTEGDDNSALGNGALHDNNTGERNVAIGILAGRFQTTGSDNIYIANVGVAGESGQIKIGTVGTHTDAFIAGIDGNVVAGSAVLVTASGELGVAASSLRFKQAVRDMGGNSEVLIDLRPVTFEYRKEVGGADGLRHYGLIAEDVAAVAPDLVAYDEDGKPFAVRYQFLAPMLLNEMQKQQSTDEGQAVVIEVQRQMIAALSARLEEVEQKLAAAPMGTDR